MSELLLVYGIVMAVVSVLTSRHDRAERVPEDKHWLTAALFPVIIPAVSKEYRGKMFRIVGAANREEAIEYLLDTSTFEALYDESDEG